MNTSQLTFTRFIAAVLIVFYHYNSGIFTTSVEFLEAIKYHFNLGVSYFYVLSGFVMMLAYGKRQSVAAKNFLINRFSRIYPLHIFSLAIVLSLQFILALRYGEQYHINFSIVAENLALIQAWIPKSALTLNKVAWSISVEMFFYLCFPFVFNHFIQKYSLKKVALVIIPFWIICQMAMNGFFFSGFYSDISASGQSLQHIFLYFNPFFHLNQFLIGLLFGKYFITNYDKMKRNYDIPIIILTLITCAMVSIFRNLLMHNGLLAVNFAILISLIAANEGKISQLFRKKACIYLGEISFAIYLLQIPVFLVMEKGLKLIHIEKSGGNVYLYFFLSLIVLIIASHFTYKWIEIPFKNKIKGALCK